VRIEDTCTTWGVHVCVETFESPNISESECGRPHWVQRLRKQLGTAARSFMVSKGYDPLYPARVHRNPSADKEARLHVKTSIPHRREVVTFPVGLVLSNDRIHSSLWTDVQSFGGKIMLLAHIL
jgi:hypothetical protein